MNAKGALLAQVNPASGAITFPVQALGLAVEITRIVICNVTAGAVWYSLFHDDTGGTAGGIANAVAYQKQVPANSVEVIEAGGENSGIALRAETQPGATDGGRLGVEVQTSNALTISIYGVTARASEAQDG